MNKRPSSMHTVRFSDCDLFGHLNNARYIDYFLNAREQHLADEYQFNLAASYQQGAGWVVGGHQISYIRPAAYNEKVVIGSRLIKVTAGSLLVEMHMTNERQSQLKAFAWTTFVPVNIKTGRRENHSDSFMDFALSVLDTDYDISGGYERRMEDLIKRT